MLTNLFICDVVLIQSLSLDLKEGFSVFTGETGAGKSILLDAISLSLGKRGDLSLIRKGAEQAIVAATFDVELTHPAHVFLKDNGFSDLDSPQTIRLRRILHPKKSKAFINDVPVSVALLKEVGDQLLDIHSQFDSLFNPAIHREILDQFIRDDGFHKNLHTIKQIYQDLKDKEKALEALLKYQDDQAKQSVLFESVRADLTPLKIEENEEEALLQERLEIGSLGKALPLIERTHTLASSAQIQKELRFLLSNDVPEGLKPALEQLESALLEVEAQASDLMETTKNVSDRLNQIDERLHSLRLMSKKYNVTTDNLPTLLAEAQKFLTMDFVADRLLLEKQIEEIHKSYVALSTEITKKRQSEALDLAKQVESEFASLKLLDARLKVMIKPLGHPGVHGMDDVEFQIAANKGQDFSPLAKSASGGELSRIMLALKAVMSQYTCLVSIVFDEIDTGVGGSTASAIGERLKLLTKKAQVLSITHSPQVAAKADHHYLVEKVSTDQRTQTQVLSLPDDKRLVEVARMLSGNIITDAALVAAKELLK